MGTGLALVFLVQCLNHDETSVSPCLRPRDINGTGQASIERLRSIGAYVFFRREPPPQICSRDHFPKFLINDFHGQHVIEIVAENLLKNFLVSAFQPLFVPRLRVEAAGIIC